MKAELTKEEKSKKKLLRRTYRITLGVVVIFAITSLVSGLIGKSLDQTYGIKPFGSIATLIIGYVIAWGITLLVFRRLNINLRKTIQEVRKEIS